MTEWIDAATLPPATNTPVLVTYEFAGGRYTQIAFIDEEDDEWRSPDYSKLDADVVAWMPLPEPYKGDERYDRDYELEAFIYSTLWNLRPNGESKHDRRTMEHIESLGHIASDFVNRLATIASEHKDAYLASQRNCGQTAEAILKDIEEILTSNKN